MVGIVLLSERNLLLLEVVVVEMRVGIHLGVWVVGLLRLAFLKQQLVFSLMLLL